jgi:hypothetical protein
MINACNILVGNPERTLRRPRCKWQDNIRMDHRKIGWDSVDWMHVAQDRDQWWAVVEMVMNIQVS